MLDKKRLRYCRKSSMHPGRSLGPDPSPCLDLTRTWIQTLTPNMDPDLDTDLDLYLDLQSDQDPNPTLDTDSYSDFNLDLIST